MNDKFYLGKNVSDFKAFSKQDPITGVFMEVDDEGNGYMAGAEGNVLTVLCHSGNQTMANNLLTLARGFQYQGFSASDAELPIEAELGDGLTVNGLYSMLANQVVNFGGGHLSEVSAPGDDEVDHAYPYVSPEQRSIERKIAETRAQFVVGLDTITSRVDGIDGKYTELKQTVSGLQSTVSGKIDGKDAQSIIEQEVGKIALSVGSSSRNGAYIELTLDGVTISGSKVYVDGEFEAGSVSADNITAGTLSAGNIDLDGALSVYEGNAFGGYLGFITGRNSSGSSTDGIGFMYSSARGQVYATSAGARIGYGSSSGVVTTSTGVYVSGGTFQYEGEIVSTSDREKKDDIRYGTDEYDALFDKLKPVSYKYKSGTSGRRHTGLIAQDLKQAINDSGMTTQDFAAYVEYEKDNGVKECGIRYAELVSLCIDQIQKLKIRVKELEHGRE